MNIARALIFVSFLLLFNTPLFSQNENTVLWKVTSPDGITTSYLFGWYPSFSTTFINKYKIIGTSFRRSDYFFSETKDMSYLSNKFINEKKVSEPWSELATPEQKYNIRKFFAYYIACFPNKIDKVPLSYLRYLGDGFMAGQTARRLENTVLRESVFMNFLETAQLRSMKIVYLQSWETTNYLFPDSVTTTKQTKEEMTAAIGSLDSLINEYRHERYAVDSFAVSYYNLRWSYCLENSADSNWFPKERAVTYKEWMKKITKTCTTKSAFIKVDIWHLMFDDGLIQLLRKENFTVEPIPLTDDN